MIFPPLAGICGLFGAYFAWKYFALYLPNKRRVDECLPSGGTCSIDGMANLELSGGMMVFFLGAAVALFVVVAVASRRTALSNHSP